MNLPEENTAHIPFPIQCSCGESFVTAPNGTCPLCRKGMVFQQQKMVRRAKIFRNWWK